jgi:3-hydroxyisobutyrate dehydrogenase-like beta-hydroxyacid dehydrogenase
MTAIGFIGLGIMGKPMSKNLLKAGYDLVVYDINPDCVKDVAAAGARTAASVAEVAKTCGVILPCCRMALRSKKLSWATVEFCRMPRRALF